MQSHVFISYRTEDAGGFAETLYDALVSRLGSDAVFIDRVRLKGGQEFSAELADAVQFAAAVIILIGPAWLFAQDRNTGQQRLSMKNDLVRLEVTWALAESRRAIPVYLQNQAPLTHENLQALPDIAPLADLHGLRLRAEHWDADLSLLLTTVMDRGVGAPPWPLVTSLVPDVRALVRLADDLCVQSDLYLKAQPSSEQKFRRQVADLDESLAKYSLALEATRTTRLALRDPLTHLPNASLAALITELFSFIDLLPRPDELRAAVNDDADLPTRHGQAVAHWTEQQSRIRAQLLDARELLNQLERQILALYRGRRTEPDVRRRARAEALLLLNDYTRACLGLRDGVLRFVAQPFHGLATVRDSAWANIAPPLIALNNAFAALERRKLEFEILLDHADTIGLAKSFEAVKRYQWSEFRDAIDGSLVKVIVALSEAPESADGSLETDPVKAARVAVLLKDIELRRTTPEDKPGWLRLAAILAKPPWHLKGEGPQDEGEPT